MLPQLLPARADNHYGGHTAALWVLGLLLVLKSGIAISAIVDGYGTATSADGVPLDTYPSEAVRTILALLALVGAARLTLYVMCVLALIRYRALVPLMFVLLLLEQLGRQLVLAALPIVRTGTPPVGVINAALLALIVAGLALSLWTRGASVPPVTTTR